MRFDAGDLDRCPGPEADGRAGENEQVEIKFLDRKVLNRKQQTAETDGQNRNHVTDC